MAEKVLDIEIAQIEKCGDWSNYRAKFLVSSFNPISPFVNCASTPSTIPIA
jgi:hypothetical protein